jgi:hypothetical protein
MNNVSTSTAIPTDLLAQLSELINVTQTVSADADKWRMLLRLLVERGYGPRIDPAIIVSLLPHPLVIADIVAASQEVPPPTAAPKSTGTGKRRIITDADRDVIRTAHADGQNIQAIRAQYDYSLSTIERVLHPDAGDAA